jgi:hypothetical protein
MKSIYGIVRQTLNKWLDVVIESRQKSQEDYKTFKGMPGISTGILVKI